MRSWPDGSRRISLRPSCFSIVRSSDSVGLVRPEHYAYRAEVRLRFPLIESRMISFALTYFADTHDDHLQIAARRIVAYVLFLLCRLRRLDHVPKSARAGQ